MAHASLLESPAERLEILKALLASYADGKLTAEENSLLNTELHGGAFTRSASLAERDFQHRGRASTGWADRERDGAPSIRELLNDRDDELLELATPFDTDSTPGAQGKEAYAFLTRDLAASRIQAAWRMKILGHDSAAFIQQLGLDEHAALQLPDLNIAKEAAREMLPQKEDGRLYAPTEGLAAFDSFGAEVRGDMSPMHGGCPPLTARMPSPMAGVVLHEICGLHGACLWLGSAAQPVKHHHQPGRGPRTPALARPRAGLPHCASHTTTTRA